MQLTNTGFTTAIITTIIHAASMFQSKRELGRRAKEARLQAEGQVQVIV